MAAAYVRNYPKVADAQTRGDIVLLHWYVVGASIGVVVLVVTSLVIAAYVMWKRRLVFMMKIVHYFQEYEEDDGKEYDAFVSYKSCPADETFVLEHLYPKLENELNFRLCVHFRDFLPGDAIANNIVRAIESSRRTIMVLSPAYVKSEWCRMEYQKAQHEMLKLKHRIIPIVLQDISEVRRSDKNLNSILNSVTYLEWPSMAPDDSKKVERFWKKLELSLPKKASVSSVGSTTASLTSPAISPSHSNSAYAPMTSTSSLNENAHQTLSSSTFNNNSSPSRPQRTKKRDLKHFVDKLIRTKLYTRQDSTSSQAALVDDEATPSRSSCESVCEELTDSADSVCSTPVTAHSYLNEACEDAETNAFFTESSGQFMLHAHRKAASGEEICENEVFIDENAHHSVPCGSSKYSKNWKEHVSMVCEKDHCEGAKCSACLQIKHRSKKECPEMHCQDITSDPYKHALALSDSGECDICRNFDQNCSDNNRVRISAVGGSDNIRIQRVQSGANCKHSESLQRDAPFRGSVKDCKDATNMELLMRKRKHATAQDGGTVLGNRKHELVSKGTQNVHSPERHAECSENSSYYIDICENV